MNFQVDVLASRVRLRFLKMWSDFVSTVMNEASQLVFRVCMAIFSFIYICKKAER